MNGRRLKMIYFYTCFFSFSPISLEQLQQVTRDFPRNDTTPRLSMPFLHSLQLNSSCLVNVYSSYSTFTLQTFYLLSFIPSPSIILVGDRSRTSLAYISPSSPKNSPLIPPAYLRCVFQFAIDLSGFSPKIVHTLTFHYAASSHHGGPGGSNLSPPRRGKVNK
jgi:hypothetical protein